MFDPLISTNDSDDLYLKTEMIDFGLSKVSIRKEDDFVITDKRKNEYLV